MAVTSHAGHARAPATRGTQGAGNARIHGMEYGMAFPYRS